METCVEVSLAEGSPTWCWFFRPPPDLPSGVLDYADVYDFKNNNPNKNITDAWMKYKELCNIIEPAPTPSRENITGYSTFITTEDAGVQLSEETAAAGGTLVIVLVTLLVALLVVGFIFLYFCWKKKHGGRFSFKQVNPFPCRSAGSSRSLSIEEYESNNYLHNKAIKGESWSMKTVSSDQKICPQDENNSNIVSADTTYLVGNNKSNLIDKSEIESQRSFDKLHSSSSIHSNVNTNTLAIYENENYQPDIDNAGNSPGANSDTPFLDQPDGSVLPNQVPPTDPSETSVTASSYPVEQSQKNVQPPKPLPPIESKPANGVKLRSPKKRSKKTNGSLKKHKSDSFKSPTQEFQLADDKNSRKSY